jgi:hypothetical protein
LLIGLPLAAGVYLAILRLSSPGFLTTLGRGVLDSVAHGVARRTGEPQTVHTSDATVV